MLQVQGIRPSFVRKETVGTDAEQFGIGALETGEVVREALVLSRTDRTPVQRIEREHHVFLSTVVAELHILLVLILQGKIRCGISNFDFWCDVAHLDSSFTWLSPA